MTQTRESRQGPAFSAAAAARQALKESLFEGCRRYDRGRHLARVIPVAPDEIADLSPEGRRAILHKLARALRAERNRGRAGHRHIALSQAYAAERRAVAPG